MFSDIPQIEVKNVVSKRKLLFVHFPWKWYKINFASLPPPVVHVPSTEPLCPISVTFPHSLRTIGVTQMFEYFKSFEF